MKEQIQRVKGTDRVPILLVGNKCDLSVQRQVKTDEGLHLAEFWGCPFVECSAKIAQNVNTVFAEIVREMNFVARQRKQKNSSCFGGCCDSGGAEDRSSSPSSGNNDKSCCVIS